MGDAKESEGDMMLKCGIAGATELLGHNRAEEGARYGIKDEYLAWDIRHSAKKKRGGVHEARARGLESGGSAVKECSKEKESSVYISEDQESGEIERSGGIEKRYVMSEKEKMAARGRGKKGSEAHEGMKNESVGRGRGKKRKCGPWEEEKKKVQPVGRGKKKKSVGCGMGKIKSGGIESGHSEPHDAEESGGVGEDEMSVEGGEAFASTSGTIATSLFQTPSRKSYVETGSNSEKYIESGGGQ